MTDEPDIWRAADLLMKRHGLQAAVIAARRSDDLRAAGDVEGCEVWQRILEAVAEVCRTTPGKGERVN